MVLKSLVKKWQKLCSVQGLKIDFWIQCFHRIFWRVSRIQKSHPIWMRLKVEVKSPHSALCIHIRSIKWAPHVFCNKKGHKYINIRPFLDVELNSIVKNVLGYLDYSFTLGFVYHYPIKANFTFIVITDAFHIEIIRARLNSVYINLHPVLFGWTPFKAEKTSISPDS